MEPRPKTNKMGGGTKWPGGHLTYPLVNCPITMENHHFQWVNLLFLWSFSIAMLNYQRVSDVCTQNSNLHSISQYCFASSKDFFRHVLQIPLEWFAPYCARRKNTITSDHKQFSRQVDSKTCPGCRCTFGPRFRCLQYRTLHYIKT